MRMLFVILSLLSIIVITGIIVSNDIVHGKTLRSKKNRHCKEFAYRPLMYNASRYKRRKRYANRNDIPNHIMRKKVSSRRHSQYADRSLDK